jgi:putative nucleotidyltransferase with HDIG domain
LRDRSLGAKVFALRGYIDARRGRLDTAEAWFRQGLEAAQDESSRVGIALYYTRELTLRRREDACDVLAPFADSTTLPHSVLIDVKSSFAQGLAAASRLDEARAYTDEVLALLDEDATPALRARVYARAAYVANESGAFGLARKRALIAAPLAIAESLYEVAVSAFSTLYTVAYGEDDAVASLENLRSVRDMGGKSGTLRFELYALLGMYELYAEAGDETALAQLERQLAAIDKHDAGVEVMEALLPAKALQAAWAGQFDAAVQLVRPTAEQYATPERRALSWAQIGVFRAAQDDAERARDAFWMAQNTLRQVEARTTLSGLTYLMLGLAAWITGDSDAARRRMADGDQASIGKAPRLRALRSALAALIGGSLEPDGVGPDVSPALAQLRAASFGGWARLIEALPCPPTKAAGQRQTVGTVLAKREFPARLDAAAKHGNSAVLRAWLDALPGSALRELSLPAAFDRWADSRRLRDSLMDAAIVDLRREVEAYQPRPPAFIKTVDGLDASIAELFEHLDIASPLTAEHSRAVSAWCSRIARMLGLAEDQIQFFTRCGLVHDIGKMRTPAEILNAPRALTASEWSVMRDHAAEGGRIVSGVLDLRQFVPVVRSHHERLDGKGYPDGLRSSAIPFAARIVAVADSFNAMIARRPYRVPLTPNAALNELECNRGTQFDPDVVAAMVRVVSGQVGRV